MDEKAKTKEFLKKIISLPGISGHETAVSDVIAEEWRPYTDEVKVSPVGNLYGIKKGSETKSGRTGKRLMMAVHMDGIGMTVIKISGEILYFAPIGGFDPRILPGQRVAVHAGEGDIPGIIVQLAPHLLSEPFDGKPVPLDQLVIDTGLDSETVSRKIRVGDIISYATVPQDLPTDCIAGHSLDNRASVAAVTQCLSELQRFNHAWDVYAVGTVQEETAFLGGHTSPMDIKPDLAIAIDVTFATGPGASGWETAPLESGVVIGYGANLHPALFAEIKQLCQQLDIPHTLSPQPLMSGTDADPIQITGAGVPTILLSIPLRYMHTPVEIISMKDVMRTGHLMAEFIARLEPEFTEKIIWEDPQ